MRHRTLASAAAIILTSVSIACSERSPVAPPDLEIAAARVQPVTGCYGLSFFKNGLVPVTTLVVGNELILKAHVDDCAGNPATRGSVTFQYCSLKGVPPGDITRADEAPSSACANGTAKWAGLLNLQVNANGDALMNFGYVSIPRTIGFRFKYSAQQSGISSGQSVPVDFTWVSAL